MPTSTRSPSRHGFTGSAELNAMVERVAPSILGLLAEGWHDRQDVVHALIRLAVTDQVKESGGRYALVTTAEPSPVIFAR